MKLTHVVSFAAVLALAVPAVALACKGKGNVFEVTVREGKDMLDQKQATFVDANGEKTRTKLGVIPGAVLLTSSSEFDATKELPAKKDGKLIFYCANTKCSASHEAAKRAKEAGWMNVAVLPEGIKGWVDAGMPVQKAEKPATAQVGS